MTGPGSRPRLVFVCWGNICRSPMAERIARQWASDEGLDVDIVSAGTTSEEEGHSMDRRARAVLDREGIDSSNHIARRITASQIRDADWVIAAEPMHLDQLRRMVPDADNLHLISDFDPEAAAGEPLPDPWYGTDEGFDDTLAAIRQAMPGIMDAIRAHNG